jgi:cytochrome c biogenesis protein CcmG, thiol:disulfide interchange protein DsbE
MPEPQSTSGVGTLERRWFGRTEADIDGRVSIDWGVYGVPETFVIDRDGRIVYKQIGPIPPHVLEDKLLPLIRKLQQQKDAAQ